MTNKPLPAAFGSASFAPLRAEVDVRDCPVEGKIPHELSGGFYATGPDPQYPLVPPNILFDGEGHARMFRIKNGRMSRANGKLVLHQVSRGGSVRAPDARGAFAKARVSGANNSVEKYRSMRSGNTVTMDSCDGQRR